MDLSKLSNEQLIYLDCICNAQDAAADILFKAAGAPGLNEYGLPYNSEELVDRISTFAAYMAMVGLSAGVGTALVHRIMQNRTQNVLKRVWEESAPQFGMLSKSQIEATRGMTKRDKKKIKSILEKSSAADDMLSFVSQMYTAKEANAFSDNPVVNGFKSLFQPVVRGVVSVTSSDPVIPKDQTPPQFKGKFSWTDRPVTAIGLAAAVGTAALSSFYLLGKYLTEKITPSPKQWTKKDLIEAQKEYNKLLGEYLATKIKMKKEKEKLKKGASFPLCGEEVQKAAEKFAEAVVETATPAFIAQAVGSAVLPEDKAARLVQEVGGSMAKSAGIFADVKNMFGQAVSDSLEGVGKVTGAVGSAMKPVKDVASLASDVIERNKNQVGALKDIATGTALLAGTVAGSVILANAVKGYKDYKAHASQYARLRKAIIDDMKKLGLKDYQLSVDVPNAAALRLRYMKDTGKLDEAMEEEAEKKRKRRNLV